MTKIHFRPYIPNQTVLFPQRINEDIATNFSFVIDEKKKVIAHYGHTSNFYSSPKQGFELRKEGL